MRPGPGTHILRAHPPSATLSSCSACANAELYALFWTLQTECVCCNFKKRKSGGSPSKTKSKRIMSPAQIQKATPTGTAMSDSQRVCKSVIVLPCLMHACMFSRALFSVVVHVCASYAMLMLCYAALCYVLLLSKSGGATRNLGVCVLVPHYTIPDVSVRSTS